jgi:hypothetical protein
VTGFEIICTAEPSARKARCGLLLVRMSIRDADHLARLVDALAAGGVVVGKGEGRDELDRAPGGLPAEGRVPGPVEGRAGDDAGVVDVQLEVDNTSVVQVIIQ